jgi:hypothetical protein
MDDGLADCSAASMVAWKVGYLAGLMADSLVALMGVQRVVGRVVPMVDLMAARWVDELVDHSAARLAESMAAQRADTLDVLKAAQMAV